MNYNRLGRLFETSALALGGGGLGQVWGKTTREEAVATVRHAYDSGINLFDMAPLYGDGEAERVMARSFAGGYPDHVHLTTKCMIGSDKKNVAQRLTESLDQSCERLNREFVDVYILHGFVIPDNWQPKNAHRLLPQISVEWSIYQNEVLPVFQELKQKGRIGGFGITAASIQECNLAALESAVRPDVVQCITNVLNSPGSMAISDEIPDPIAVIEAAQGQGVGVMGIRAVSAGALTDSIDRKVKPTSYEAKEFALAEGFRALAKEKQSSTAQLAHHFALSMQGVDTVVLGVKNRVELAECLEAEAMRRMSVAEQSEALQSVKETR